MKKIFLPLFIIFISFTFVNAEEIKKDKKYEKMTEEQLIAEFMKSDKELKQEKAKTIQLQKETNEAKELGKTLDEIKNKLNVKWKKDYKK